MLTDTDADVYIIFVSFLSEVKPRNISQTLTSSTPNRLLPVVDARSASIFAHSRRAHRRRSRAPDFKNNVRKPSLHASPSTTTTLRASPTGPPSSRPTDSAFSPKPSSVVDQPSTSSNSLPRRPQLPLPLPNAIIPVVAPTASSTTPLSRATAKMVTSSPSLRHQKSSRSLSRFDTSRTTSGSR